MPSLYLKIFSNKLTFLIALSDDPRDDLCLIGVRSSIFRRS